MAQRPDTFQLTFALGKIFVGRIYVLLRSRRFKELRNTTFVSLPTDNFGAHLYDTTAAYVESY